MRLSLRLRLTRQVALVGIGALASAGLAVVNVGPAAAATSATVSINAGQTRATFPAVGVGMNVAV